MLADFYRQLYPGVVMPGYHCPGRLKPHMNTVYLNKDVNDTMISKMVDHSYDGVVKKLTSREKAELYKISEGSI